MTADLMLTNARVLTLNPRQPMAHAVAVNGETILAVGAATDLQKLSGPDTQLIDCQGLTLLPGFVDAHCHLLALASSLTGIGCGEESVKGIGDLMRVIGRQAGQTPPGEWIRGYGYDHLSLREMRHPTRWDLDEATLQHPVRLNHRSGHAVVLNSQGLALAGIGRDTPDPVGGVIQRDPNSGEPTGVLFEMAGFLRERLAPVPDRRDQSIRRLNRKLLECGITSVQDAGPNNDPARWSVFRDLVDSGSLVSRVTMMAGATHLQEFTAAGMIWGSGDHRLRLGHAKIMLTLTTGELHPSLPELKELVSRCHRSGFPVAIHAVESDAVAAAAAVLGGSDRVWANTGSQTNRYDRIEHCSECPVQVLGLVRTSGAVVVTQPGFVYWNGDGYLDRVPSELLPHLYGIDSLHGAGISVAFSSDAPVIAPDPWPGICAAVTGYTRLKARFPRPEATGRNSETSVLAALRQYTIGGALAEGTQQAKGSIQPGKLADLILVDADPTRVAKSALDGIKTVVTVVGGRVAWERDP
ncbi:MAG TPA: amidohydrolase [Dehalococcoidia bacterium]|nr:amidohydrolase [Dehalococcoidia bacterium]